jgi:hypothetical protein
MFVASRPVAAESFEISENIGLRKGNTREDI